MKFWQYVPGYSEGEPFTFEFNTLQELLNHPKITQYKDAKFYRWSQSDDGLTLMLESEGGKHWWVVGYSNTPLDLPKWEAPR